MRLVHWVLGFLLGVFAGGAALVVGGLALLLAIPAVLWATREPARPLGLAGLLVGVGVSVGGLIALANARCADFNVSGVNYGQSCSPLDATPYYLFALVLLAAGAVLTLLGLRRPTPPGFRSADAAPERAGDVTQSEGAVRMEPKRSIRVPRKLWLAVAAVVLGVLLLAQNSTVRVDSYRVVDLRTIAVRVGVAPCSWTRVTNVAETPTDVRVKVETLPCPIPGPGTAALAIRELTVSLAADLGTRAVEDANGQAIPSQ